VARSDEAHERLQALLREHEIEREYLALVRGRPRSRRGRIEAPIGRDRREPTRMSLDTERPREAVTHFEVVELLPRHALLRVRLETGRTHQIRVHLEAVGLPVSGDTVYGVPATWASRASFLHAARLAFPHPFHGGARGGRVAAPGRPPGGADRGALAANVQRLFDPTTRWEPPCGGADPESVPRGPAGRKANNQRKG
jgi:23S rRNA-/tRNA-specific pseudouridylate synthase